MALIDYDGFTTYGLSQTYLQQKYPLASSVTLTSVGRRANTVSLTVQNAHFISMIDATSTLCVGTAVQLLGIDPKTLITFRSGSDEQISLRHDSSGQLYVSRNGTTLWTSGVDTRYRLTAGTWNYVEFMATINTSTGSWSLRMNGAESTLQTQTGVNTAAAGGTTVDRFVFSGYYAYSTYYTDMYVTNGTGPAPKNGMLGDCRMDILVPTADGFHEDFTLSTGTDSFALLDEATMNSDTDYISSATPDDITTVQTANLPYTPTVVYGVKVVDYSRKDDSGARESAALIRTNSTDYVGDTIPLTTEYARHEMIWDVNPDTSTEFTPGEVDGLEIGIKVVT